MKITRKPPRFHQDCSTYFLTFCTFKRKPLLHRPGIPEMLLDNIRVYSKHLQKVIAYTIMPDHMHLLVEAQAASDLSVFLKNFKKWTSVQIHNILQPDDSRIWQRGTMDHCIRCSWTNKDYQNHLQYLFFNSWKHLQIAPKDFLYHNFSEFVRKGWFDEDFCAFESEELTKLYE